MDRYLNYKCPVCEKNFAKDDDIVVCPTCGTPHHRECYFSVGKCAFDDKHDSSFDWKKELNTKEEIPTLIDNGQDEGLETRRCPKCGFYNLYDSTVCKRCNAPLYRYNPIDSDFIDNQPVNPYVNSKNNHSFDPFSRLGFTPSIGDIPSGDVAKFVGPSFLYYIKVFEKLSMGKKVGRFNFAAFLFAGPWMLYRKQYKLGGLITGIVLALNVISIVLSSLFSSDIALTLLSNANIDINSVGVLSYQQSMDLTNEFLKLSAGEICLVLLPSLIWLITFTVKILIGIFANRWYYNHCIKMIKDINKNSQNADEFNDTLRQKGGVNTAILFCSLTCLYIINNFLPTIL